MKRRDGSVYPCRLFGLCDRDHFIYRGTCTTCRVIDIFIELNKLEGGKGIRALRTTLDDFPCAIWRVSGCAEEPKEAYAHICESCKVRGVYLEYIEAFTKEVNKDAKGTN